MENASTYAQKAAARTREGDRWVALRTLRNPTTTILDPEAPAPAPSPAGPERRPLLYEAVVRRHLEARQRLTDR